MKITELMLDDSKKADGVWVDCAGYSVQVRSLDCKEFSKMHSRLMKPYQHIQRRNGEVPEDVATSIFQRCVAETILLDWKGIQDEKGKEIPFSKELALEYLQKAQLFANDVVAAATNIANFRLEAKETAVKNSKTS